MRIKLPKKGRKSVEGRRIYELELKEFAESLITIDETLEDKVTARGWCYLLEGFNIITKNQFNSCQNIIKRCRKRGYLPMDFVASDDTRRFHNVEHLTMKYIEPKKFIYDWLRLTKKMYKYKDDVAFWKNQKYYIQMMVEKIDVLNIFKEICKKYHIPISNSKGNADLNSRYYAALRFKEAEENINLQPVLLYYGDFDPAGKLISDSLMNNFKKVGKSAKWSPKNLIIDRFGLNYEFIENNDILWIDNLTTGSGRNLGNFYNEYITTGEKRGEYKYGKYKDEENKKKKGKIIKWFLYSYEIEWIEKYGVRKIEANAILPIKNIAIDDCEEKIKKYLGENPFRKYNEKIMERRQEIKNIFKTVNMRKRIKDIISDIEHHDVYDRI